MSTDLERLVVQMSADFKSYENALAKASGITRAELKRIKADAASAGSANEAAFNGLARGMKGAGSNVLAFRTGVQQASYQVQDFAAQVSAGTAASVALGQQLPQLLGAFGVLGSVIGAGVAIGLPLVATALRGLRDESVPLEDRLKALTDALNAVKSAAELQAMGIDEPTARYGRADVAVQQLIASTARLATDQALAQVRELQTVFSDFADTGRDFNLGLGEGFNAGIPAMEDLSRGVQAIIDKFGVTVTEAERLQGAFVALSQANGVDAVFRALVNVLQVIEESRSRTGGLNDAMTEVATEVQRLADVVGQVRGGVEQVTAATGAATQAAAGLASAWGSALRRRAPRRRAWPPRRAPRPATGPRRRPSRRPPVRSAGRATSRSTGPARTRPIIRRTTRPRRPPLAAAEAAADRGAPRRTRRKSVRSRTPSATRSARWSGRSGTWSARTSGSPIPSPGSSWTRSPAPGRCRIRSRGWRSN